MEYQHAVRESKKMFPEEEPPPVEEPETENESEKEYEIPQAGANDPSHSEADDELKPPADSEGNSSPDLEGNVRRNHTLLGYP